MKKMTKAKKSIAKKSVARKTASKPSTAKQAAAPVRADRPHMFIQTNAKQSIGAIVSAYSMKRNSAHADEFDVTIMHQEDYPFFAQREGQTYMRHGVNRDMA